MRQGGQQVGQRATGKKQVWKGNRKILLNSSLEILVIFGGGGGWAHLKILRAHS